MQAPTYRVVYAINADEIVTFEFDCYVEDMELVIEDALERIWEDHDQDDTVVKTLVGFSILKLHSQEEPKPEEEVNVPLNE